MESSENIVYIGLDGETSSLGLSDGGKLIQAGVAIIVNGKMKVFTEYISWPMGMHWDQHAEAVHGISQELTQNGRYAENVDEELSNWLISELGEIAEYSLISVGWNVAAFDHPFFLHALPKTMQLVSRRAVELNSLCFAKASSGNVSADYETFDSIKSNAKDWGKQALAEQGIFGKEHDAGYDAALGLMVFRYFNQL